MKQFGEHNQNHDLAKIGLTNQSAVYWNLQAPELYEHAISADEAVITAGGALMAVTGQHTGRSAQDKFIVKDATTETTVWWDNNKSMTKAEFDTLYRDMLEHAADKQLYAQDLYGGADPDNRINVRVVAEFAWHSLFIRTMLIRPDRTELASFLPEMTIINLPSFKADPEKHGCISDTVIACDLTRKIVLIGNTSYAGEMKKSVFSFLNFLLPKKDIMPMHCSANVGDNDDSAIFFGLSGTGKTTLSADPDRTLLGDDEHGWGPDGIFNFEGGCYAKTIRLSEEAEPEIYATTKRFGTVLENVVLDENQIGRAHV